MTKGELQVMYSVQKKKTVLCGEDMTLHGHKLDTVLGRTLIEAIPYPWSKKNQTLPGMSHK